MEKEYDVVIIGGGPAGMMAGIKASEGGASVLILEKNKSLGKKVLLTGGGRCNLTNAEFNLRELIKHYNNGEFLFNIFSVFGPKETIEFFEKIGLKTKTEKNGRVFPASDTASEVVEVLVKNLKKNKVEIMFGAEVVDIEKDGNKISKIILKDSQVQGKNFIIATGGKSYPLIGSTGIGYKLAEKLGHSIVHPLPALSPIMLKDEWVKELQGVALADVKINIFQGGKRQFSEEGEILFTHLGISGPTVLNTSSKVSDLLEKGDVKIAFDLFPLLNNEELLKGFEDVLKQHANRSAKNILSAFVPEKLAEALLKILNIEKDKIANNMSKIERMAIIKMLKNIEVTVEDVMGFDIAKTTKGGISLKEIDPKTMKSKIIENLYFAGEIIDVDGKSGGFNLQMCWTTGFIAGQNAS